jgi:hypothetical protein
MSTCRKFPLAKSADHLETIQTGHVDIQKQQVERLAIEYGKRCLAVWSDPHRVSGSREEMPGNILIQSVILCKKDPQ